MHALENIKVADFTTMINGPYATMLLSDMGADVIKIEPLYGDSWRAVGGGFLACNRGKRAISIDLKKTEAKQIAYDLIAVSDMVVENARYGVWKKLGLDYESVKKIKPDLIYISILAHGSKGPFNQSPGFDPVLQAKSGQMVGQGGIGKPPLYHVIALNDQAAPMLGAFGAVLALLARVRKGKGQQVETSLTHASVALQSGEFIDYDGIERICLGDTDLRGLNAVKRHYQALDGRWIFIFCSDEKSTLKLFKAIGKESLSDDLRFASGEKRIENDAALVNILQDVFITRAAGEWVNFLEKEKIPVALAQSADDVLKDVHCEENKLFIDQEDQIFGMARLLGVGPKFSGMSGIIRRPAPMLGQHTRQVLGELGYSKEKIDDLLNNKVIYSPE